MPSALSAVVSVTLESEDTLDTISPTSSPSHLVPLPPPGNNCLSRPSPLLLPSCVRPAPCRLQLSACLWTVTLGSEATISGAAGREFCPRGRTSAVPALSSTSHCPLFPVDFPSLFIVRVFFRSLFSRGHFFFGHFFLGARSLSYTSAGVPSSSVGRWVQRRPTLSCIMRASPCQPCGDRRPSHAFVSLDVSIRREA